ncbi:drug/metabolite transporter (DMT)-like permease [Agrobacterium tumefaciens]|uniref:Drug/metabolite transporter (DMT)-like permease n=1 Tax=Agrobacterium radiobacter TaxID=362 RepID=A0ABD5LKV0_AGRRD|nr:MULTISPECIES: EamA family transporter [Agrobacterium tumefaciens complex]MCP2133946.1 drug/metabolite transporter (DMT)-like permease [Rhizobium sp. SLBN-94]TGE80710.1 EamA family transporter [Rhizobium sp. SEMIA 439]EPR22027.1 membrane protein [Agrobacterium radiobacter DSM 30147]KAA1237605.1 EamA family transporter [Agrobacterium tumefaciens]KAB0460490.1 EamA family transporter [Agrobacterium tumefaciens]
MTPQNTITRELLLLALLSTLWAASYTFIKIGVETIPPITFIALRTLIAGLLLYVVIRLRGLRLPTDFATWRLFFIQACINSVLPFTLIAWAEQSIDAGLAVILNATTPIFTFLLTALVIRHEPVSGRKLFGTIAGMTGVCLIIGVEALSGAGEAIWSQLAVLTAAFSYACAAIFSKNFKGLDPVMPAAGSLICGAVLLLPVSLIVDRPWTLSPSAASLTALVCLSVFSTALAFMIYFRLMQTLGSVGTTSQAYLRVPVGVAIGMAFLGEMPTPAMWVGLVCVIAGVLAMTLPSRRRRVVQGG